MLESHCYGRGDRFLCYDGLVFNLWLGPPIPYGFPVASIQTGFPGDTSTLPVLQGMRSASTACPANALIGKYSEDFNKSPSNKGVERTWQQLVQPEMKHQLELARWSASTKSVCGVG
jgi:hypothetical protein